MYKYKVMVKTKRSKNYMVFWFKYKHEVTTFSEEAKKGQCKVIVEIVAYKNYTFRLTDETILAFKKVCASKGMSLNEGMDSLISSIVTKSK